MSATFPPEHGVTHHGIADSAGNRSASVDPFRETVTSIRGIQQVGNSGRSIPNKGVDRRVAGQGRPPDDLTRVVDRMGEGTGATQSTDVSHPIFFVPDEGVGG